MIETKEGDNSAEDDVLLLKYRDAGDVASMDVLVSRNSRWLLAYLRGGLSSSADADDAFQEVWVKIIRSAAKYKPGNFRGWVMRVAHNVIIDKYRRQRHTISIDGDDDSGNGLVETLEDTGPAPGSELASFEDSEAIMNLVRNLPDLQKEVFLMRVEGELSFKEIAEITGSPLNTVLGRMHYAVERLRNQINLK